MRPLNWFRLAILPRWVWPLVWVSGAAAIAGDYDLLGNSYQFLDRAPPARTAQTPEPRDTKVAVTQDERPVITVYSFPGCRPCQQLKLDAEKLPGYRWVFAGAGPGFDLYPRLSWVSPRTGSRVYMAGQWGGPDWWHRTYMEPPK